MTPPKKFLCIGPGGRKCPCCFPAPGSKARKSVYRSSKRKAANEVKKIIEQDDQQTSP